MSVSPTLAAAQSSRLKRFHSAHSVDLHCHCLAGLDDGPVDVLASMKLCEQLVADGVTTVITTPHQLGRYETRADLIHAGVRRLNADLISAGIPLSVRCGAEVRVDERLIELVETGDVLTLDDAGKYLLLELPSTTFVDLRPIIRQLAILGITAIIAHPERHPTIARHPEVVQAWIDHGAILQLNAGSLLGNFGQTVSASAWHLLEAGVAALIASDAHDARHRRPCMTSALAMIEEQFGFDVARTIGVANPERVLLGEPILPLTLLASEGGR